MESLGPNSRKAGLMERAWRSPTRLTDASANSRAVLNESALRLVDCNGSNGGLSRPLVWLVNLYLPTIKLYEDVGG